MSALSSLPPALDQPTGTEVTDEGAVATAEWNTVKELIDDVFGDLSSARFARSLVEWRLATRQFRNVETRRIVLGEPDETDLLFHAICLHTLLAMGETLKLWSRGFTGDRLGEAQITREDFEASVESLKQSFRTWHHGFTAEEVERTRAAIFDAAS